MDWETTVAQAAMVAMVGAEPLLGPLTVAISFRRKSLRHVDLDNLSKAVLDACNEIVWRDDRQIDLLILKKTIGVDDPGIKVTVYER